MNFDEFEQVVTTLRRVRHYLANNTNQYTPDGMYEEVEDALQLMELQFESDYGRRSLDDLCDELYEAKRDAA